jgi:hypothetical protein
MHHSNGIWCATASFPKPPNFATNTTHASTSVPVACQEDVSGIDMFVAGLKELWEEFWFDKDDFTWLNITRTPCGPRLATAVQERGTRHS